jgi:hypothetical protein
LTKQHQISRSDRHRIDVVQLCIADAGPALALIIDGDLSANGGPIIRAILNATLNADGSLDVVDSMIPEWTRGGL